MKVNQAVLMVLRHLRNAFETGKENGDFTITDGKVALAETYLSGEWVAITGSRLNDGIYRIKFDAGEYLLTNGTDNELAVEDESFTGSVWRLGLPKDLIDLCKDVQAWLDSSAGQPGAGAITSESVVGFYSVKFATPKEGGNSGGWESAFANRINSGWRNMYGSALFSILR